MSGPVGLYTDAETSYLSQDLSGYWKFEPTGADRQIEKSIYNKKDDEVFVPGFWESLGYMELDGFATYRKSFYLDSGIDANDDLYLVLGYIDDEDEVFLNGKKIGEVEDINRGSRNYYRIFRGYEIPKGLLETSGRNTIEVIVYDSGGLGGIYEGPVGIATEDNFKKLRNKQEKSAENYWNEFFKMIFD
jgi:sialate O-acetylesterase